MLKYLLAAGAVFGVGWWLLSDEEPGSGQAPKAIPSKAAAKTQDKVKKVRVIDYNDGKVIATKTLPRSMSLDEALDWIEKNSDKTGWSIKEGSQNGELAEIEVRTSRRVSHARIVDDKTNKVLWSKKLQPGTFVKAAWDLAEKQAEKMGLDLSNSDIGGTGSNADLYV